MNKKLNHYGYWIEISPRLKYDNNYKLKIDYYAIGTYKRYNADKRWDLYGVAIKTPSKFFKENELNDTNYFNKFLQQTPYYLKNNKDSKKLMSLLKNLSVNEARPVLSIEIYRHKIFVELKFKDIFSNKEIGTSYVFYDSGCGDVSQTNSYLEYPTRYKTHTENIDNINQISNAVKKSIDIVYDETISHIKSKIKEQTKEKQDELKNMQDYTLIFK